MILGNDFGGKPSNDQLLMEQAALLQAIVRQLDLLIQLECGAIKRSDLKAQVEGRKAERDGQSGT